MKCPACGKELAAVTYDKLTVDVCNDDGCGGMWFDNFELRKVEEPTSEIGEKLAEMQKQSAKHAPTIEDKRHCPKCADVIMMRHYFSVKKEVLVDECAGCGGIWLDAGELDKIRHEYGSDAERDAAADKLFHQMFDPALSQTLADERRTLSGSKLAQLHRFLHTNLSARPSKR